MNTTSAVRGIRFYSACCYAAGLASLVWCGAFLADLPGVPTVDGSVPRSAWLAVPLDVLLLLLFAIPHSILARAGVKRRLRSWLPQPAERSTYVLFAGLCLGLLLWQWQALPADVWHIEAPVAVAGLWMAYAAGWAIAVAATFLSDHLTFFGLRQGWSANGRLVAPVVLTQRWLYAWVRHPMMLGLVIAFWVTPRMTVGHLVFAVGTTAYVVVGVHFEERDLRAQFGAPYDDYAQRVPGLVPLPRRRRSVSYPGG